jgi:hypothetical protein
MYVLYKMQHKVAVIVKISLKETLRNTIKTFVPPIPSVYRGAIMLVFNIKKTAQYKTENSFFNPALCSIPGTGNRY